MAHEHLNDILTPDQMKDARIEAVQRHPNHNIDAIMEIEFSTYVSYSHNPILMKECEDSILIRLKEMVELQYSLNCIKLYEQTYRALKDTLNQGDNYDK